MPAEKPAFFWFCRSVREAYALQQILKSRIAAHRIIDRVHLQRCKFIRVLRVGFFEPDKSLVFVSYPAVGRSNVYGIYRMVSAELKQPMECVARLRRLARAAVDIR